MNFKRASLALGIALSVSSVQAGVTYSVEAANQLTSTQVGVTTVDFNDGTTGSYTSVVGDFTIYDTPSGTGQSAPPFSITDKYISVPNPVSNGSATFTLDGSYNYFGFFWGSVDTYNTIEFFDGMTSVASFGGGDITPELIADGNQGSWNSNRYVNFFFDGGHTFDSFVMTSTSFAFETDNHSYGNVAVPESGTLGLLSLGLLGLGLARRRKA
ncbi:PEP-CTERM sorting domain-containing protein [Marinobacter salinisoli]|uniref:PEP-CTERM sorting domain-containing protein n=1 Tax=Marinobacter salinisoli TaxID=2769486 RepID=A0ABX7MR22_9GAMM|nr:PEP-CTERM sorting domain-containing protein [Marinobacter salinisoli]QSP94753.1 PEP-CTERM sorting domain-containing protein [Marinobacter salinisoli]